MIEEVPRPSSSTLLTDELLESDEPDEPYVYDPCEGAPSCEIYCNECYCYPCICESQESESDPYDYDESSQDPYQ